MHTSRFEARLPLPQLALRDAHISEYPTFGDGMEIFETPPQGDWSRRLGRRIAVPAAEAPDDPGGPGQAVALVRVLLQRRLAFDLAVEPVEHGDLRLAEGNFGWLATLAVARLHQLQGRRRGLGGNGGEPDQALGGGELAVLELQAVRLHQAEQLLDRPAKPVPVDDLPGRRHVGDGVAGE